MKKYCLALDLVNDAELIQEYERWHKPGNVWPEVRQSIIGAGIQNLEIYRTGNRLFMIMEVDETFSFERKKRMDAATAKVQEWETLMNQYQQLLPWAGTGEKWVLMEKIYQL